MSYAHQKIDNPTPANGDKFYTFSAALATWVLTSFVQLGTWLLGWIPIEWGTYTPTLTGVANIDSVSAGTGVYFRVGGVAAVALFVNSADATAAAATQFDASIPVASNFSASTQCLGIVSGPNVSVGRVQGDATNDRASIFYNTSTTSATQVFALFLYRVI